MGKKASLATRLESAELHIDGGLGMLAKAVSGELTQRQVGVTLQQLKTWADDIEALRRVLKQRTELVLLDRGTPVEGTTKLALDEDGVTLSMHLSRTGYDPKKVEKLLRNKNVDIAMNMIPSISYKVDERKLHELVGKKTLTQGELEACRYDKTWVIDAPAIEERE